MKAAQALPKIPKRMRPLADAPIELGIFRRLRADAQYCLILSYLAFAALVLGSVYLTINRPEALSESGGFIALAILWAGMLPTFHYLLTASGGALPFLPLFGAAFAVFYGFTAFSKGRTPGVLGSVVVSTASLWLALCGLLLLYVGFVLTKYLVRGLIKPLHLKNTTGELPRERWLRWLVWLLLAGHLAFSYIPGLRQAASIATFLEPAGYIGFGMLFLLWRRKRLPSFEIFLLLFICLPAELLWRFTSGALAQVILLGLFFQILIWYERRRIPWLLIAGTLLFYIPLQPVKSEYRRYTYQYGRYAHLNPIGKAKLFADLTSEYYFGAVKRSDGGFEDAAASRVADIRILSFVMSRTPEPVAYWNGRTLTLLFSKLVPRVFWPDKPNELVGQEFGHRYSLLAPDDRITSMNLPWMVELYANFGTLGVLFGMPLAGLLFALLTEKLGRAGMNELDFVVGATILFRLSVDQESNFSLVAGGVALLTLALILFFRFGFTLGAVGRRDWGTRVYSVTTGLRGRA